MLFTLYLLNRPMEGLMQKNYSIFMRDELQVLKKVFPWVFGDKAFIDLFELIDFSFESRFLLLYLSLEWPKWFRPIGFGKDRVIEQIVPQFVIPVSWLLQESSYSFHFLMGFNIQELKSFFGLKKFLADFLSIGLQTFIIESGVWVFF